MGRGATTRVAIGAYEDPAGSFPYAEIVVAPMVGFVMVTLKDPEEPMVIRMETPAIHMAFSGAAQLAAFELTWERITAAALEPKDSVALLSRLIRSERRS
jgi:Domain of unknown function (DUF5753)